MSQRILKFRAWDKLTKTMRHGNMLEVAICFDNPDFEVMQFTGLRDSPGNNIWESDVVRVEGWWDDHSLNAVGVVEFDEAQFQVRFLAFEGTMPLGNDRLDLTLVMGNIYEHPKLQL